MAANTSDHESARNDANEVRKAFSKLPFDHQISTLVRIELDMLGDAVDTVASAVSKAVDEIVDACVRPPASAAPGEGGKAPAS